MKKITTACLLVSALSLQCCVAGAFVAGGAAGGSMAYDKRTFTTMAEDQTITFKAERRLADHAQLSTKAHVVVATYDHVVLLAGEAPTPALKAEAENLVRAVPKVKKIYSQIIIADPISISTRSKDAVITANVKTRMLTTTNLKSSQFKILTENGTVYIMGISDREESDIAATVARNSSGVKRVVKVVEVE
jgi:osmotically-inducible protein OsmY